MPLIACVLCRRLQGLGDNNGCGKMMFIVTWVVCMGILGPIGAAGTWW